MIVVFQRIVVCCRCYRCVLLFLLWEGKYTKTSEKEGKVKGRVNHPVLVLVLVLVLLVRTVEAKNTKRLSFRETLVEWIEYSPAPHQNRTVFFAISVGIPISSDTNYRRIRVLFVCQGQVIHPSIAITCIHRLGATTNFLHIKKNGISCPSCRERMCRYVWNFANRKNKRFVALCGVSFDVSTNYCSACFGTLLLDHKHNTVHTNC